MTTQPEALYLADNADKAGAHRVAAKLRRLHGELQATERQVEILSDDLSRCSKINAELLEALTKLLDAFERTEAGFPPHVEMRFAIRDMARAAIAKATGEQK